MGAGQALAGIAGISITTSGKAEAVMAKKADESLVLFQTTFLVVSERTVMNFLFSLIRTHLPGVVTQCRVEITLHSHRGSLNSKTRQRVTTVRKPKVFQSHEQY